MTPVRQAPPATSRPRSADPDRPSGGKGLRTKGAAHGRSPFRRNAGRGGGAGPAPAHRARGICRREGRQGQSRPRGSGARLSPRGHPTRSSTVPAYGFITNASGLCVSSNSGDPTLPSPTSAVIRASVTWSFSGSGASGRSPLRPPPCTRSTGSIRRRRGPSWSRWTGPAPGTASDTSPGRS